jgi:endonuclease VIII
VSGTGDTVPEGDTVWLTAHRLGQALTGRVLTVSDFRVPALATTDLTGRTVSEVLARGKHILTRIDDDLTVHSHLRMDGSWYLSRPGVRPRRHPDHMVRARLGNAEWTATGFRVHDLAVVRRADEARFVAHLGPDLLGPDWDADRAVANLRAEPGREIGDALLDQRLLAGVGNLYKCEVLFVERVNPWTPVGRVPDLARLAASAYRLLRANRDHPAQSTTGYVGRDREHWVYERSGLPCLRCRTPVRRELQGAAPRARPTYWCPTCQPAPD